MIRPRLFGALFVLLLLAACASLPPQTGRDASYALTDTADTRLGTAFAPEAATHPGADAFSLLLDPIDALDARILLADRTDRSLDLQYYIWHSDQTGHALASVVLRAADRGVRVRVLLDDLGTNADDQALLAIASHPHIQIRLFNPVANRRFKTLGAAFEFSRVDRRMHNKAMIADNQVALVGGRNVGDEYFGASTDVVFGDLDVVVHGAVVRQASTEFDTFWNSPYAYPIESLVPQPAAPDALEKQREKLRNDVQIAAAKPYTIVAKARLERLLRGEGREIAWGQGILLYDDPAKIVRAPKDSEGHLFPQLRALALQPKHEMLIVSPYFVPNDAMVERLRAMTVRGVRVTVLTNSLAATDVAAVHAGYRRYREALLDAGVQLYELRPSRDQPVSRKLTFGSSRASLHAKTYVFDHESIFIGSMNLDPRSIQLNTEIGVYCESPEIATTMANFVGAKIDQIAWRVEQRTDQTGKSRLVWIQTGVDGSTTEFDTEPDASAWRRMEVWLLGLLPIDSQL
jgi:putative cardiolipin synthase